MIILKNILPVLKLSIFGILLWSCHQKMKVIPVYAEEFGYFWAENDMFVIEVGSEVEEVSSFEFCLLGFTKHSY